MRKVGEFLEKNKKTKREKGSVVLTTPIIVVIGTIIVNILIVVAVKILMPYIWYEKLSSTCIKYIFIMEEYGYLTRKEAVNLKEELKEQGFDEEKITLSYVGSEVNYGDPIYLKVMYEYDIDFPIIGYKSIPMEVERVSVSKR